jgi:glucose/mannose-6-phosphate isomerase
MNNGFINEAAAKNTENAFEELQALMIKRANEYSDFNSNTNKAIDIARRLHKTIPVIYSAEDRLDSINIRWRNQIQENAKNLAFGGLLPEMNHNEVNGWTITDNGLSTEKISDFTSIFLKDPDENPRISLRYEFLQSILKNKVKDIIELTGEGTYLLTRMTDLIYLADWVSYYMALLNNTDPTPIPMISDLKELLAKK